MLNRTKRLLSTICLFSQLVALVSDVEELINAADIIVGIRYVGLENVKKKEACTETKIWRMLANK